MYPQNLHTHAQFSDGKSTYEEHIAKALELGFTSLGFSEHSCMSYCQPNSGMKPENIGVYQATVKELKQKYNGIIDLYCGIEFDMYSEDPLVGYDYVIGSVHYLKKNGVYIDFDRTQERVRYQIDTHYDGNGIEFAKHYYETLMQLTDYAPNTDIVGHIDIIAKNNEKGELFDESDKVYKAYAIEAVKKLCNEVGVFEINTGAISRGYRSTPYPSPFILKEIKKYGGQIVISSDCHQHDSLACHFDDAETLAKECGFTEALIFVGNGFKPIKL